jgi:hydrogenase expression/formation protein HypC
MCLGIPAQLVEIVDHEAKIAKAEIGGVRRDVSFALLEGEPRIGEWVLVHVGFALDRIDEEQARETLELFEAMGQAYEEELKTVRASTVDGQAPESGAES